VNNSGHEYADVNTFLPRRINWLIFSFKKCLSTLQTNEAKSSALEVDGNGNDTGVQAYKHSLWCISCECILTIMFFFREKVLKRIVASTHIYNLYQVQFFTNICSKHHMLQHAKKIWQSNASTIQP
jgi:hypothetical protein